MRIVEPSVVLWRQGQVPSHVARCARVCYGKEGGGAGDDEWLCRVMKNREHWSMFRHATYYAAVVDWGNVGARLFDLLAWLRKPLCPTVGIKASFDGEAECLVAYNGNWALDYPAEHGLLIPFLTSVEEFVKYGEKAWRMVRHTFKVTTQDATAKELNRVSPNNIAEVSTRRVAMDAICRPHWLLREEADALEHGFFDDVPAAARQYYTGCRAAFNLYKHMVAEKQLRREDARGLLPKDTATTVVYTYDTDEWDAIVRLRSANDAHPNCRVVAQQVKLLMDARRKELGV